MSIVTAEEAYESWNDLEKKENCDEHEINLVKKKRFGDKNSILEKRNGRETSKYYFGTNWGSIGAIKEEFSVWKINDKWQ